MNSIKSTRNSISQMADHWNKSKSIINGLISADPKVWAAVLSYESEFGIYKVLAKVFNSYAGKDFRNDEKVYSVEDLAGWLISKDKFSSKKLLSIKASNDGSFFRWVREMAINAITDSMRKHRMNYSDIEDTGRTACTEKNGFETRDYLERLIIQANLCTFQRYIIQRHDIDGFKPEDVVRMYGERNNKTYTMNYYYSQRSKALSSLAKVAYAV